MIDEHRLDKTVQKGVVEDAWSAFLWPMRGVPAKSCHRLFNMLIMTIRSC